MPLREFLGVLRATLILIGIASAAMLASKAFSYPLNEPLQAAMTALDGALDVALRPLEQLVIAVVSCLHAQDVSIEVADHWKHAFILLWLLYGAVWGFWAPPETATDALVQWSISGVMALVASVLFATVPLNSRQIFTWPGIGVSIILTVRLWTGGFRLVALYDLFAPVFVLLIILALHPLETIPLAPTELPSVWPIDDGFFASFPNEAFARLIAEIAVSGALLIVYSAFDVHAEGDTFLQKWSNSRMGRLGFNIVFVIGGAAAVIAAARSLT